MDKYREPPAPPPAPPPLIPPPPPDPRVDARPAGPVFSLSTVTQMLQETAPWVRFLAIVGFASVGLMILVGLGAGILGLATQKPETVVLMVIYPLMSLLYFFPSLYLLQYARRIREYVQGGQQLPHLEQALYAQRKFFKFTGILVAVSLALSVLLFFGVLALGVIFSSMDVG